MHWNDQKYIREQDRSTFSMFPKLDYLQTSEESFLPLLVTDIEMGTNSKMVRWLFIIHSPMKFVPGRKQRLTKQLYSEKLTLSEERSGLCHWLLGDNLGISWLMRVSLFPWSLGSPESLTWFRVQAGHTERPMMWFRTWALGHTVLVDFGGTGGWDQLHGQSTMPTWCSPNKNWPPTRRWVSFLGWQYSTHTITHWCYESNAVPTPWGEDNWKLHIWYFLAFCPTCFFLWLILTCILSL